MMHLLQSTPIGVDSVRWILKSRDELHTQSELESTGQLQDSLPQKTSMTISKSVT